LGLDVAATIDGFVLAALLTSLSLSLQGDRGAAPWAVRALAVTAAVISLVFNLQHVPAGMARWGEAVPPVAVLAGLEVLLLQVRRAVTRQGSAAPLSPPAVATAPGVQSAGHAAAIAQSDALGVPAHGSLEAEANPKRVEAAPAPGEPQTEAVPVSLPGMPQASATEAAARQQARQLYVQLTAAGQRVTGAALGRAIGRSERYGRLLLTEFRAAANHEAARNGERPPLDADPFTT
jgi:hypothetical protein